MRLDLNTPAIFAESVVPSGTRLAGFAALLHGLQVQAPIRQFSCVSEGFVKGSSRNGGRWTIYDKRYWPGDTMGDHLGFALTHETLDLLALKRILERAGPVELAAWVRSTPTGIANRRAWFFYEFLTGERLDLPDLASVKAVDALDPKKHFTAKPVPSPRHRVRNNLLGDGAFCPVIQRTERLEKYLQQTLANTAAKIVGRTSKHLVTRAASFMLLADSRASFEIEGERPLRTRLQRWGKAVLQAGRNPLRLAEVNRLHAVLMEDTRFVRPGLRPDGVFLGERDHENDPLPEFIGARPEDLEDLMNGLIRANARMAESGLDAVLQAAATAFGFVYIHPLQDGNGRLHRFLIHHVLAERAFSPPGMVFPVSSVMLDRIDQYRDILRAHTGPLLDCIDWLVTANRNVDVVNDTADLYRYFDCTAATEFLYACVETTVLHDLPQEIAYLQHNDLARQGILDVIDMPDRLVRDFIMFVRQNGGRLPRRRRQGEFNALTDDEVRTLETIVNQAFENDKAND